MIIEKFKDTDALEDRVNNVFNEKLTTIDAQLSLLFNDAFNCQKLGEAIYKNGFDPVVAVLPEGVYKRSFKSFHDMSDTPATFDYFLKFFSDVFLSEEDSLFAITFDIPFAGKLIINVNASIPSTGQLKDESGDFLKTQAGDNLAFRTVQKLIYEKLFFAKLRYIENNILSREQFITQSGDRVVFRGFYNDFDETVANIARKILGAYGIVLEINLNFQQLGG